VLVSPKYLVDPEGHVLTLTLGRQYEVLGIEADFYRILNDEDDPVLYSPDVFSVTDASEPAFWRPSVGADGERYAYPEAWDKVGFFEDFHDRREDAREIFWRTLSRLYPETASRTRHPG
jgi:hypothetical protein